MRAASPGVVKPSTTARAGYTRRTTPWGWGSAWARYSNGASSLERACAGGAKLLQRPGRTLSGTTAPQNAGHTFELQPARQGQRAGCGVVRCSATQELRAMLYAKREGVGGRESLSARCRGSCSHEVGEKTPGTRQPKQGVLSRPPSRARASAVPPQKVNWGTPLEWGQSACWAVKLCRAAGGAGGGRAGGGGRKGAPLSPMCTKCAPCRQSASAAAADGCCWFGGVLPASKGIASGMQLSGSMRRLKVKSHLAPAAVG